MRTMRKTPATVYDVLTYAHDLLLMGWCQGPYAVDETGRWVSAISPGACRFCLAGGLLRAHHDLKASNEVHEEAYELLNQMVREISSPHWNGIDYNEAKGRKQHEVLMLLGLAAQRVKQEGEK